MLSGRKFKSCLPGLGKASSDTPGTLVGPLTQPRNESQELLRRPAEPDPNFKDMLAVRKLKQTPQCQKLIWMDVKPTLSQTLS